MLSLKRFAGKGGEAMRENCGISAASIKTASGTDFGMSAVAAARAVAAVFLTVMFGIFLIIVFPLTESERPFGKAAPVRVVRHQGTVSYRRRGVVCSWLE